MDLPERVMTALVNTASWGSTCRAIPQRVRCSACLRQPCPHPVGSSSWVRVRAWVSVGSSMEHRTKTAEVRSHLLNSDELTVVEIGWSTGLILCTRRHPVTSG